MTKRELKQLQEIRDLMKKSIIDGYQAFENFIYSTEEQQLDMRLDCL